MRKVLVTGGAGFIGSYVVNMLLDKNIQVNVLELPKVDVSHLDKRVVITRGSICDPASVYKAAAGCDTVMHLAANPNLWDRHSSVFTKVNYQGTKNVLHVAQSVSSVTKFVHVSTESILYSPYQDGTIDENTTTELHEVTGAYCRSKWLAEQAAIAANRDAFKVVVVNPTVPVGPGDRNLGPFSRLMCDFAAGRVKGYVDGLINFIDVEDAAKGIIQAASVAVPGKRYILGSENWQITKLFKLMSEITKNPVPRFRIPHKLAYIFALAEESYCKLFDKQPMATVCGVKLAKYSRPFNSTLTMQQLEMNLKNIETSLTEMYGWLQEKTYIKGA